MSDNKIETDPKSLEIESNSPEIDQVTGMQIIKEETKKNVKSAKTFFLAMILAPLFEFAVGFGVAEMIFEWGDNEKFAFKINLVFESGT